MRGLHQNQKKILEYLLDKKDGATLDEIADHLGITRTAAKDHIVRIESFGYLSYQDTRGLVGRPKRRYLLSEDGVDAFPKQYSWLANILLDQLASEMSPAAVSKLMRDLAGHVAKSMEPRFARAGSSAELISMISEALNELGYRSVVKQRDLRKGAILEATNCVYHSIAKKHPELCQFDTEFITRASGGMSVKLESCIARGGQVCRFCVRSN